MIKNMSEICQARMSENMLIEISDNMLEENVRKYVGNMIDKNSRWNVR